MRNKRNPRNLLREKSQNVGKQTLGNSSRNKLSVALLERWTLKKIDDVFHRKYIGDLHPLKQIIYFL